MRNQSLGMDDHIANAADGRTPATSLNEPVLGEAALHDTKETAVSEKDSKEVSPSVQEPTEQIDGGIKAYLSVVVSFIQFFVVLGKYVCKRFHTRLRVLMSMLAIA